MREQLEIGRTRNSTVQKSRDKCYGRHHKLASQKILGI